MSADIELICGVALMVFGLSYAANAAFWAGGFKKLMAEPAMAFPTFLLLLICGMLMVIGHNLWVANWRIVVTLVGWAILIKAIGFLLFPGLMRVYARWPEAKLALLLRVGGVTWFIVGAVITYFSLRA